MYVPQYHQPQVAAAYPVRQTPAHQVRPMVVSPQVQQVPMLNQDTEAESCRFSMIAIIYISNSVVNDGYNHADSCEAYKLRTENLMRATVNICQSYIDPDCTDSMQAIGYLRNFVVEENSLYPCEAYKPRTDNYMMAVTNICNSYLTSSAPDPDACCKSAMISITNISNSVRNDNPSDSCEAYKQRIINFMNDILDYTRLCQSSR